MSKKVEVSQMDTYTLKRWFAFIEGVNLICKQAAKNGINEDDIEFKQNYLVQYIDEQSERIRLV